MKKGMIGKNGLGFMLYAYALLEGMNRMYEDFPDPKAKNRLHPSDIKIGEVKKPVPKGCKIYTIEGVEIVASNEKNAIRKYHSQTKNNPKP